MMLRSFRSFCIIPYMLMRSPKRECLGRGITSAIAEMACHSNTRHTKSELGATATSQGVNSRKCVIGWSLPPPDAGCGAPRFAPSSDFEWRLLRIPPALRLCSPPQFVARILTSPDKIRTGSSSDQPSAQPKSFQNSSASSPHFRELKRSAGRCRSQF